MLTGKAAVNQAMDRPMASVLREAERARKPRARSCPGPNRQKYRIGADEDDDAGRAQPGDGGIALECLEPQHHRVAAGLERHRAAEQARPHHGVSRAFLGPAWRLGKQVTRHDLDRDQHQHQHQAGRRTEAAEPVHATGSGDAGAQARLQRVLLPSVDKRLDFGVRQDRRPGARASGPGTALRPSGVSGVIFMPALVDLLHRLCRRWS